MRYEAGHVCHAGRGGAGLCVALPVTSKLLEVDADCIGLSTARVTAARSEVLSSAAQIQTRSLLSFSMHMLSKKNVVIVDTKNELGGEGVIPHREAIGESRRVMVSDHTKQDR